jgi:hypothetical protein
MSQIDLNKFFDRIKKGKTEEDIKNAYAKYFDIMYDTADRHDLYTPRVLFEFKYDKNFTNLKARSQIIAQTLYYVRRLKFDGFINKPIPPIICIADQNESILTETALWKTFYDDAQEKYDWDLAPSMPDKQLVQDISDTQLARDVHVYNISEQAVFLVFAEQLSKYLTNQLKIEHEDKKQINEGNFEEVFDYWNKIFGDSVRNGFKTSRYFVSDIQKDNTTFIKEQSRAFFRIGQAGEIKEKKILAKDYEHFWGLFDKVRDIDIIRAILAKIDRLTDDTMRRFHGEFFTPLKFANKALDYIEKTIGKNWWQSGEYRLWDMAAGTGNLEYHLPQQALQYCYLSTLYKEDKEHLDKLFADATIFQYDYLNDDIENVFADKAGLAFELNWKLPEKLRNDLNNPKIKWIILINPPFATASAGASKGSNKKDVTETRLRKYMHRDDLGEVSRELFSQFIYRLNSEFTSRETHLCLFSKLKYITSNNDQKLRDKIFDFVFERGFIFSSVNFEGTSKSNQFPVGCIIWKLNEHNKLENQIIEVDVFNENVEKIDTKLFRSIHKDKFLSKWVNRPPATHKFPPFGSAISVKAENKDKRDRISDGFIASLMAGRNDFQNQNIVYFLSGPAVNAGAYSITADNFDKSMIVHAAQRIPKATWLNDRDQFMKPQGGVSDEFIADCTVWNLFCNSNQTAALKDVEYEKKTYQIHNHFFPFKVSEVKNWDVTDSDIALNMANATDTFVSQWLATNQLSAEATAVLNKGKEIYKFYFAHLNQLRTNKFKIDTYDAGWWQIKQALADENLCTDEMKEIKTLHDILKAKILPKLKEYQIID